MVRPLSQDHLPATTSFAANLRILREFTHHLQFAEIALLP